MSNQNEMTAALSDCPLVGFLPFTKLRDEWVGYTMEGGTYNLPYTHLAAAVMAADDFNKRNAVITPQLVSEPFMKNCTAEIPTPLTFANTDADHSAVPKYLVDQAYAGNRFCAVVGPYTNTPTIEASKIAAGMSIPLVTHGADDNTLSQLRVNPQVARTTVNLHAMGEVVVSWFRSHGRTDFLATVAVTAEFGDQFRQTVDNAAKEAGFRHHEFFVIAPPWSGFEPNRGIGYALEGIKKSGFRNIFLALTQLSSQLTLIADYAEQFGMNRGDHVWAISGNVNLGELSHMASQNANISKLVNGMGAFRVLDGFSYRPETDSFLRAWKEQDATMVERVNAVHPIQDSSAAGYYQAEPDYFQKELPQQGAGFMYDAVMTIGLGKCLFEQREREEALLAEGESEQSTGSNGRRTRRRIKGKTSKRKRQLQKGKKAVDLSNTHINAIFDLDFEGATGQIRFGENNGVSAGSRQRGTLAYGAYNFRPVVESPKANVTTWYYLTEYLQGSTTDLNWTQTDQSPFIFASGTDLPPPLNRDLPEQNYLSSATQATGLAFMAIALTLTLVSTVVIYTNESAPAFRQGQPTFLYVLMFGAFIMSWGIFTISFDESDGWTEKMLDSACLVTPWLVSMGYMTMYLAMFSKLWRVNKVLQFRRRQVLIRHVVGPFIAVLLAAIAVLLTWTLVDPFTWERLEVDETTGESYGRCQSEHGTAFASALTVLMAISTVACAFMAFKCRDIDSRFQESDWIFYTIFLQIQVLLVGIPVLVILQDASADATYLGRSLLIFVIVITNVGLMIWPKAFIALGIMNVDGDNRSVGTSKRGSIAAGSVRISGAAVPAAISGLTNSDQVHSTEFNDSRNIHSSLDGIDEDGESEDASAMTSTTADPSRSLGSSMASGASSTIRKSDDQTWSAEPTTDLSSVDASSTGAHVGDGEFNLHV